MTKTVVVNLQNDEYDVYIGREFGTIGDEETGGELKESVEKRLVEVFGDKYNCRFIEETVQG